MEGVHSCSAGRSCALDPSDIQFQQTSTRLSTLSVSAEQSADITILTDEGDTVMLSSREHAEADLLTYEHLSCNRNGNGRQELQQLDFEAESEFTLAVQGNLSDQEMADIQALLKDLGGMLKAFLTGAGENRLPEAADNMDRFETISAFKADFEYRVSAHALEFEADQLSLRTAGDGATAVSSPVPDSAVAATDPAAGPIAAHRGEAEQTAARMAKRVHESGLSGHRRMKHLKKFLKNFLENMLANHAVDAGQARRGHRVIERFLDEFKTSGAALEVQLSRAAFKLQVVSHTYEAASQASMEPAVIESA